MGNINQISKFMLTQIDDEELFAKSLQNKFFLVL